MPYSAKPGASTALALEAQAQADRRTSLTRNELSITMDRMALGVAASAEMDREGSGDGGHRGAERSAPSDLVMVKVWDMHVEKAR